MKLSHGDIRLLNINSMSPGHRVFKIIDIEICIDQKIHKPFFEIYKNEITSYYNIHHNDMKILNFIKEHVDVYIGFFRGCTKEDIGKILPANNLTVNTLIKLL